MNASHAKQPASSLVLPSAPLLRLRRFHPLPSPRRLFNPRWRLTHAYVATGARTRVHVSYVHPSRFFRRGGESGPKRRRGVTKVAGYFISVRRITCRFVLSLPLPFPRDMDRVQWSLRTLTDAYTWALRKCADRKCVRLLCRRLNFVVDVCVSQMEAQLVCCGTYAIRALVNLGEKLRSRVVRSYVILPFFIQPTIDTWSCNFDARSTV